MSFLPEANLPEFFEPFAALRESLGFVPNLFRTCEVLYDSTRKTLRIVTDSGSFEYPEPIAEPLVDKIMSRIRSTCGPNRVSPSD